MARRESVTIDEVIKIYQGQVIKIYQALGGEADLDDIRRAVISRRGDALPFGYKDWDSCRKSIDQVTQRYCPTRKKFLNKGVHFVEVSRGRYRTYKLHSSPVKWDVR